MTSPPQPARKRLVEDFARYLWARDSDAKIDYPRARGHIPDNYLNEAAVFLAGELGQRLQHARQIEAVRTLHVDYGGPYLKPVCQECQAYLPCPTLDALEAS